MSLLLVLIVSIFCFIQLEANDQWCASSTWTPCAPHDSTCKIPPNINHTTISYGSINQNQSSQDEGDGQWVFVEISNTRGGVFEIECSDSNFGKVYPAMDKHTGCCYIADTAQSYINSMGPSTNENNWKQIAIKGQKFIANPITYIKYGAHDELGAVYIYRWLQGEFECSSSWFGSPVFWSNAKIICSVIQATNMTEQLFIDCGDSDINLCNLDVTGVSKQDESIVLIQYGQYPNYAHRYGYSNNNGDQIPCNNDMFGDPNPSKGTQYCAVSNSTVFTGAVGMWEVVASCAGQSCIIDTNIEYGVSSTNTNSRTVTWQHSVSNSISSGFAFDGFSFSYSLTTETSITVSNEVSNSYTQSASKTCGVTCGNGSAADWTVYQWQFKMGEYIGVDLQPFDIYACYYVCSVSQTAPQCPPTYCKAGTDCTQCQGWSPPNSTIALV